MKVVVVKKARLLEPFGEPAMEAPILGRALREVQAAAFAGAGLELVAAPPVGEPYLVVSDRTWITELALVRFLEQAKAPARLRVVDAPWLELTLPLQQLDAPGLYEVGLVPAGAPPELAPLPAVTVDLKIKHVAPPKDFVPAFEHLPALIPVTAAAVHQIDHWSHVLRANWLALAAHWIDRGRRFKTLGPIARVVRLLGLALRARSFDRARIAAALTTRGKKVKIHPTAVVEASVIEDEVEIGAFAFVRGAHVGRGAKIGEHARVTYSVLGERVRLGPGGVANLCVAYPGAVFGAGNGYQASVFGRDSFLAWSTTIFDLSFGDPVKVTLDGARVSSGMWFLGACLGHRARVGGRVVLGYGAEVPNDAVVVAPIDDVMRAFEPGAGPHRIEGGVARPLSK